MKTLYRFMKDEKGLETVEYAIMTALVVTGVVAAIAALSSAIISKFSQVQGVVSSSGGGS